MEFEISGFRFQVFRFLFRLFHDRRHEPDLTVESMSRCPSVRLDLRPCVPSSASRRSTSSLSQLLAIHSDQHAANEFASLRKRASQKVQKESAIVDSGGRFFVSPDTDDRRIHLWARPEDVRPQPSQNADTGLRLNPHRQRRISRRARVQLPSFPPSSHWIVQTMRSHGRSEAIMIGNHWRSDAVGQIRHQFQLTVGQAMRHGRGSGRRFPEPACSYSSGCPD